MFLNHEHIQRIEIEFDREAPSANGLLIDWVFWCGCTVFLYTDGEAYMESYYCPRHGSIETASI